MCWSLDFLRSVYANSECSVKMLRLCMLALALASHLINVTRHIVSLTDEIS